MTLAHVESYTRELYALLQLVDRAQAQLDELHAFLQVADRTQDHQQELQIGARRAQLSQEREQAVAAMCEKAAKADVEGVRELIDDLQARVEAAHRERNRFRAQLSEYEFSVEAQHKGLEPSFDRSAAEQRLDQGRERVRLRVEHAVALVPARSPLVAPLHQGGLVLSPQA